MPLAYFSFTLCCLFLLGESSFPPYPQANLRNGLPIYQKNFSFFISSSIDNIIIPLLAQDIKGDDGVVHKLNPRTVILYRAQDILGVYLFSTGEVRDGAGEFQNLVISAR